MQKAIYICNCVNYQDLFDNATEMAYAVKNSRKLSKKDFLSLVDILPEHKKIKQARYSYHKNLIVLYDITKDIDYFYLADEAI